jgi:hypothetical protein
MTKVLCILLALMGLSLIAAHLLNWQLAYLLCGFDVQLVGNSTFEGRIAFRESYPTRVALLFFPLLVGIPTYLLSKRINARGDQNAQRVAKLVHPIALVVSGLSAAVVLFWLFISSIRTERVF